MGLAAPISRKPIVLTCCAIVSVASAPPVMHGDSGPIELIDVDTFGGEEKGTGNTISA